MAHAPSRLGIAPGLLGSQISVITNSLAIRTLPTRTFVHYDGKQPFLSGSLIY
jgi:hypothetical protein